MGGWFAVALSSVAAAGGTEPLKPSGKWVVDYAESACVLQRTFGTGDAETTLGFKPSPVGSYNEIMIVNRDRAKQRASSGGGKLWLFPGQEPVEGDYWSGRFSKDGRRLTNMSLEAPDLEGLEKAKTIRIEMGEHATVSLSLSQVEPALKALAACQKDLLLTIGLDPAALAAVATPAEPSSGPAYWLTTNDYPMAAVRAGMEGTSFVLWTISVEGHVTECRTIHSSGHPVLDGAACNAITKRGRYRPALDKSGKPTVSWDSRRVRWTLP